MIDQILIAKKLEELKEYLGELNALAGQEVEDILADHLKYHTLERLFQLTVDTCVDINIHLIREKIGKAPDDLQSTFISLGEGGLLPLEFATKMAPVVGLRNRIVHRYDTLDRKEFIELVKKNSTDFGKYLNAIVTLVKVS